MKVVSGLALFGQGPGAGLGPGLGPGGGHGPGGGVDPRAGLGPGSGGGSGGGLASHSLQRRQTQLHVQGLWEPSLTAGALEPTHTCVRGS